MPFWLSLAKGPLAVFALSLLVLGVLRSILLAAYDRVLARHRTADPRLIPLGQPFQQGGYGAAATNHKSKANPVYVYASLYFHLGILVCSLFSSNHIHLLGATLGFTWPGIFKPILDWVAVLAILGGTYLLLFRVYKPGARAASKGREYFGMLLFLGLFVSGLLAGRDWNPIPYNGLMLFHTLSGLIVVSLVPFTRIIQTRFGPAYRQVQQQTSKGGGDLALERYNLEEAGR